MNSVLIVDDEVALATNLAEWLARRQWNAKCVYSGATAIEICQKEKFDVVLLDVRMPQGIDGFETFRRLQKLNSDICVVFFTAFGDIPSAVEAMRIGGMDFVEKPVANETLILKLLHTVKSKRDELAKRKAQAELVKEKARTEEHSRSLTFATGMAHKIDNKLAAIRSYIATLERRGDSAEHRELVIRNVRELCDICHTSLRTFSFLAKKHEVILLPIYPKELVRQAISAAMLVTGNHGETPQRKTPRVEIKTTSSVLCAGEILTAALECLIENALDASSTDDGIEVVISEGENGMVTFEIKDEGQGFSPELLSKPLAPFQSTRNGFGHLGFGLYFASEVARFHGGEFTFGNRSGGKGAFVKFSVKKKGE